MFARFSNKVFVRICKSLTKSERNRMDMTLGLDVLENIGLKVFNKFIRQGVRSGVKLSCTDFKNALRVLKEVL